MSDEAKYTRELAESYEEYTPDDLVQGDVKAADIILSGAGEYKRGQLLMSDSDGYFIPATSGGMVTANELCILCEDVTFETDYAETFGYFEGEFNRNRIILPEGESMTVAVAGIMRRHKLYVR